jgi:large subunit ribosomal protein L17
MRHGKKVNHLSRRSEHRAALLMNMANSLIEHKRITTTLAKAKALRVYIEPLITRSKTDSTHSRRTVFSYLRSKEAVTELFREVAPKVADRPGGYTRIIRTGFRHGDNAESCLIELVDFNTIYGKEAPAKGAAKKRTRRGTAKKVSGAEGGVEVAEDGEPKAPKARAKKAPAVEGAEKPAPKKKAAAKKDDTTGAEEKPKATRKKKSDDEK